MEKRSSNKMNKKASPELYSKVIGNLLSAGVNCSCYFLFGFPGETDETAERTRQFIKSIEYPEFDGALSWSLFPFILAPLSPIYEFDLRKKYGLTGYLKNWKHRTMHSGRAMEHLKAAFMELDNSGPVSRVDNLDMFFNMAPQRRKQFVSLRHRFSKLSVQSGFERNDIIESFTRVLFD